MYSGSTSLIFFRLDISVTHKYCIYSIYLYSKYGGGGGGGGGGGDDDDDDQWLKYLTYIVHCMSGITIW